MARTSTTDQVESLRALEEKGHDGRTDEERMARVWLIDELEARYPAASEAVGHAFAEADERDPSDPASEVDYVGVLLAHLPAEVLPRP